ncbi:coiled-coil domain-containing protein 87 [Rhineura floridana]|uniref:coiled-coil domain-containing protein 87 n=1 Tax=Rhineura floridana TaxID=261503 RepID=UPI002AC87620|nr:coiled-coil domain-containing protein 87 [Rhineura floridana]
MISFFSLPKRELYALENAEKATQQLHDQYQHILAPLSLFPASLSRLRTSIEEASPSALRSRQKVVPVPISLTALMQLVKGRLEVGPQWAHIPHRQQWAFRQIILTEVKHIFKDVQHSLYDPAFSPQTNRDLYQHLVTYIGLVCQHLFLHYLYLMEHRRTLAIFTDYANLTRFSAQLSLDCSRFLNVAAVRHRLVIEMKTLQSRQTEASKKRLSTMGGKLPQSQSCRLGFTIDHFIRLTRPHVPTMKQKIAKDIKELEELPLLDMNKIKQLNLPTLSSNIHLRQMPCAAVPMPCPCTATLGDWAKPQQARQAFSTSLRKSQSLPNMRIGQLLVDELGIRLTLRRLSPDLPCHFTETTEDDDIKGPARLAEDLRWLAQRSVLKSSLPKGEHDDGDDSELPPLIKALTRRKANEARLEHLQRMLSSLQQEESFEMSRRNTIIAAPASHPQAATVNFKVNDRMVVKAADMQVSERTYLEALALERCPAIYNHLLGEIDNATLKSLDANLSTGQEVRDMYKELMNTIPKDHLKVDLGPLTESPATNMQLAGCFASSTLTRKKSEQIINEELSKILPAGPYYPDVVIDTPMTPNLPFKRNVGKKQYASWLKWWKATFNTDDYLKYIGIKESDYLPVIFHLYSDKDTEEEEPLLSKEEIKKQEKVKKEAIKKAAELQMKQEEFEPGKWNSNSINVGGLGTFVCYNHKPEDLKVFQRRLERLWTVLHFTERERLDMAIKYSSNQYYLLLPEMLQAWEAAARAIQDRELMLAELEKFEETASDPNRLFSRAPQSFAMRMKESRTRSRLHSELARYDSEISFILNHIKATFNDTVTFKGRPYVQKMAWDTVEMLYWLQQERRANTLRKAVQRRSQIRRLPSVI